MDFISIISVLQMSFSAEMGLFLGPVRWDILGPVRFPALEPPRATMGGLLNFAQMGAQIWENFQFFLGLCSILDAKCASFQKIGENFQIFVGGFSLFWRKVFTVLA